MGDNDQDRNAVNRFDPILPSGRRDKPRVELWLDGATLRERGAHAAPTVVRDLSAQGFRAEWPYQLHSGTQVWLKLPGFEAWGALVVWNRQFELGCRFQVSLHPAVFERIAAAGSRK